MNLGERIISAVIYPIAVFAGMWMSMVFATPLSVEFATSMGIAWLPTTMVIGGLLLALTGIVAPAVSAWREHRQWAPFIAAWKKKSEESGHG